MTRIHPKQVCVNIKTARMEQNLTMHYMAQSLNISVSAYCDLENGRTELTLGRLQQIADILQIQASILLGLSYQTVGDPFNQSSF